MSNDRPIPRHAENCPTLATSDDVLADASLCVWLGALLGGADVLI
jgi:hypothetical protein